MKKTSRLFALLLSLLLLISAVGCAQTSDPSETDTRPAVTGLDFWICEDAAGADFSGFQEIYGWMGAKEYVNKRYEVKTDENGEQILPEVCVRYLITAWPDYADGGSFVTQITVTDPAVSVCGVTIESDADTFRRNMTEAGYLVEEKTGESDTGAEVSESAQSPDQTYTITLIRRNGVGTLTVNAPVSNRELILY